MTKEKLNAGMSQETTDKLNKIAKEHPVSEDNGTTANPPSFRRNNPRYAKPNNIKDALKYYPEHIVKLVNLIKSNRDIRRYTSLGILNYLYQKGVLIKKEGKIGYVQFNWTKFKVNNNGLSIEYRYTEPFFINCLIASFTSFANAAQKTIGAFCSIELNEPFTEDKDIIDTAVTIAENADESEMPEEE